MGGETDSPASEETVTAPKASTQKKPRQKVSANSVKAKTPDKAPKEVPPNATGSSSASATKDTPSPQPSFSIKSDQPVEYLGVDDTGEWKFVLSGTPTETVSDHGLVHLGIMLYRSSSRVSRKMPIWYEQTSTYTVGPFITTVVYKDDVDLILLDESWWRCSRDGDVYTIREHVEFAAP